MKKTFTHLTILERKYIERKRKEGKSMRYIADVLGVSPNTISREIRVNTVSGSYTAQKAKTKSYQSRYWSKKDCMKVSLDSFLCRFVTERIRKKHSPESIQGELYEEHGYKVSLKAIYKFVRARGLDAYLFRNWAKKSGKHKGKRTCKDMDKVYIDQKPITQEAGHHQVDFIVSSLSTTVICASHDPYLNTTLIYRFKDRKKSTISHGLQSMFKGITVKSLTFDNDVAFKHWKELEELLHTTIYFTHPYSWYEKPHIENRNRYLRAFVPKRTDLRLVTEEMLQEMSYFLNHIPRRKCGWKSPVDYAVSLGMMEEKCPIWGVN